MLRTVDVSYGGENGFNQAIELVADDLQNVKFIQEKKLICKLISPKKWSKLKMLFLASYFDEISKDTGKYCFGIADTISALEQGAVEKLIIWEHLDVKRYVFRNPTTEAEELKYLRPDQERDRSHHMQDGVELEVQDCTEFIEWLVETDER